MGWYTLGEGADADGVVFHGEAPDDADFAVLDEGLAVAGARRVTLVSYGGEELATIDLGEGDIERISRTSPTTAAVLVGTRDGDHENWRVVSISVTTGGGT